ncbi:MAG: hypothetical protein EP329_25630, partial [Deltaproteobacteria bacterium]
MLTRKDYLMRYIELLGDYLRRRAYGKQDDERDEEVAAALQMRLEELEDLSEEWLKSRLSTADEVDPWRALMASELALSVGELRMAEERPLAAAFLFERAAVCLDWAMAGDLGPAEARVAKHVDALSLALRSAEVDAASRAVVMRRAEEAGRFSVVEDLLFDLANDGWEEALTWGEPFYARLGALPADAVHAGGLDPADLDDDLADLREQLAAA